MGLLKLPKMPELKKGSAANALAEFVPSTVDPDSIKFKDKTREKQRQQVITFFFRNNQTPPLTNSCDVSTVGTSKHTQQDVCFCRGYGFGLMCSERVL